MKILLLGEYSALYKNLKEGLEELGNEVVVAALSDGFKRIPVDISFDGSLPSIFGKIEGRAKALYHSLSLKNYDVVQAINPFLFHQTYYPSKFSFERLIKNNHKFFLSAAGDDAYFWRHGRTMLKYGPFEDFLKYDMKANSFFMESQESLELNDYLVESSNGVIPIMYEYEKIYEHCEKRLNTIPIAMNTDKIEYRDNVPGHKISIFHGLNRYGFKGTRHVEKAFEYLSQRYPNDLDLKILGNLPVDQYLKLMQETNVVIDQLYSYSSGVNGIYALAMGKVVMGGAEPESFESLGTASSPIINLTPSSLSIISEVEKLLDTRSEIGKMGYEGRKFVEKVHSHVNVAAQYIKTWNDN